MPSHRVEDALVSQLKRVENLRSVAVVFLCDNVPLGRRFGLGLFSLLRHDLLGWVGVRRQKRQDKTEQNEEKIG